MGSAPTLDWKWEHGPPDANGDHSTAVGPAWLIDVDGTERDINAGGWIIRAEAAELADTNGWTLSVDDADAVIGAGSPPTWMR